MGESQRKGSARSPVDPGDAVDRRYPLQVPGSESPGTPPPSPLVTTGAWLIHFGSRATIQLCGTKSFVWEHWDYNDAELTKQTEIYSQVRGNVLLCPLKWRKQPHSPGTADIQTIPLKQEAISVSIGFIILYIVAWCGKRQRHRMVYLHDNYHF